MKRRWKLLIAFALVASACIGGCVVLSWDAPPPADGDLVPVRSEVPAEENGFRWFDGVQLPEDPEDAEDPGEPSREDWSPEAARQAVERGRDLLERFDRSLEAPRFQVPPIQSLEDPVEYLAVIGHCARLAQWRATLRFEAGEEREAIDMVVKVVALGHRLEGAEGDLITVDHGIAVKSIGADLLRHLVQRTRLPDEDVLRALGALESLGAHEKGLAYAFKLEYQLHSGLIAALGAGELRILDPSILDAQSKAQMPFIGRVAFKPNATRHAAAAYFRALVHYRAPWRDSPAPIGPGGPVPELEISGWPTPNAVGKCLNAVRLPTIGHGLVSVGKSRLDLAAPAVLFALRRHARDAGSLPAALDELVPRYLPRVPLDPFDAKPLKWSREKRSIWSVGPDRTDKGGCAGDDQYARGCDDPTYELEP
ncbi:MAG: hypothetical protein HY721_30545 [Planctomycetes bacterium]|nr:hypothetical protein [Planctomycetota bacterium]